METSMFLLIIGFLALLFSVFFHQHLKNLSEKNEEREIAPEIGAILSKRPHARTNQEKYVVVRRGINYFQLKSQLSGEQILVSEKKITQEYQPEV